MDNEPQEHDTTLEGAVKIVIRKDGFTPSCPWHADVVWADGTVWYGWQRFFRTRKELSQHVSATLRNAGMHKTRIEYA